MHKIVTFKHFQRNTWRHICWCTSNGWRVKVCTDEQVKHTHRWRKWATIRVMRQRAMH